MRRSPRLSSSARRVPRFLAELLRKPSLFHYTRVLYDLKRKPSESSVFMGRWAESNPAPRRLTNPLRHDRERAACRAWRERTADEARDDRRALAVRITEGEREVEDWKAAWRLVPRGRKRFDYEYDCDDWKQVDPNE